MVQIAFVLESGFMSKDTLYIIAAFVRAQWWCLDGKPYESRISMTLLNLTPLNPVAESFLVARFGGSLGNRFSSVRRGESV